MSEKRCWRCDVYEAKTEDGQCPKCSGVFGHDKIAEMYTTINQQADELREAQAEAASLRETLIATHQWIGGSVGNEPFEVQGSGKAWSAIIRVLENTTAGADLLAELEQLQGYRAFVHSCIKSGEVCVYTFEEYLEKMKSE